jgi:hypothetical protein
MAVFAVSYLYLFCPRVAAEFSRAVLPGPTRFHVGLDVSASIDRDALEKIKDSLASRLRRFVGDGAVHYEIATFGNPGCGRRSISQRLSMTSPATEDAFDRMVAPAIHGIAAASIAPRDMTPLTTPLYCFLESALAPDSGRRVIIFSDLMNDDGDCPDQHLFPEAAIKRFGQDPGNEIIFFYTSARRSGISGRSRRLAAAQRAFIRRMNALGDAGRVRVFFRRIPDDPLEALGFIRKELRTALPSTIGDGMLGRLCRITDAVSTALAGEDSAVD